MSALHVLMLALLQRGLARDMLARPRRAIAWGTALAPWAGVALGSWNGTLIHVVGIDLVLGFLLLTRRAAPGLAPLGISFHLATLLALLPALAASPWLETQPWALVHISLFHALYLALGCAVFVPLAFFRGHVPRAYAPVIGGTLALLAAVLFVIDAAPAHSVTEALSIASRSKAFYSEIMESRPLLGADSFGLSFGLHVLGYGALALPFVWVFGFRALRSRPGLLPWLVAIVPLAAQAVQQLRFTEALAAPMAIVLGWGAATLLGHWLRNGSAWLPVVVTALLAITLQGSSAWAVVARYDRRPTRRPRRRTGAAPCSSSANGCTRGAPNHPAPSSLTGTGVTSSSGPPTTRASPPTSAPSSARTASRIRRASFSPTTRKPRESFSNDAGCATCC